VPLRAIPRRDRKLNALIKAATPAAYRKGCVVYQQGTPSVLMSLIQEGHACLTLPKTGAESARVGGDAGSACTLLPLNGAAVFRVLRALPKTLSQFLRSNDHYLAEARLIVNKPETLRKAGT
jgi:hypothetical protein